MTFEQELQITSRYHARLFKEKMDRLYVVEFDKVETEEIEDLLVNFYVEMEKLRKQNSPEYVKARSIAADFIGYPSDEEDSRTIENATPLQAIQALETRLKEVLGEQTKCPA